MVNTPASDHATKAFAVHVRLRFLLNAIVARQRNYYLATKDLMGRRVILGRVSSTVDKSVTKSSIVAYILVNKAATRERKNFLVVQDRLIWLQPVHVAKQHWPNFHKTNELHVPTQSLIAQNHAGRGLHAGIPVPQHAIQASASPA